MRWWGSGPGQGRDSGRAWGIASTVLVAESIETRAQQKSAVGRGVPAERHAGWPAGAGCEGGSPSVHFFWAPAPSQACWPGCLGGRAGAQAPDRPGHSHAAAGAGLAAQPHRRFQRHSGHPDIHSKCSARLYSVPKANKPPGLESKPMRTKLGRRLQRSAQPTPHRSPRPWRRSMWVPWAPAFCGV